MDDPQYSHGYLVPVFAIVLLWLRSKYAERICWAFDWRGLSYLSLSFVIRCANLATWNIDWLDGAAFVIAVGGIFAIVGGRRAIDWAWPAIAFLLFMIPLPYRAERLLGDQLQTIATDSSAFLLQLCGLPAIAAGHTIAIGDFQLGVETACSGLSMLLLFIALAVAFAGVVRRPLLDRWLLVATRCRLPWR